VKEKCGRLETKVQLLEEQKARSATKSFLEAKTRGSAELRRKLYVEEQLHASTRDQLASAFTQVQGGMSKLKLD
jgi:hypothetical protein